MATIPASPKRWAPPGSRSCWPSSPARAPGHRPSQAHTPTEAASELGWRNPSSPGRWRRVVRRFRDGHTETWWAADAQLGGWGPDRPLRLVVASIDPERLPGHSSWYLLTNLPRPASRRAQPADLADIVRLYGLRNWVEQGYKQVKGELGWADFQVRIRSGDPPALGAGVLRVQLLLAGLPRRTTRSAPVPGRRDGRAGGAGDRSSQAEPAARLSWPVALRQVRAWLTPWSMLQRCWRSWSPAPPPRQLQLLLDAVAAGQALHLYLP